MMVSSSFISISVLPILCNVIPDGDNAGKREHELTVHSLPLSLFPSTSLCCPPSSHFYSHREARGQHEDGRRSQEAGPDVGSQLSLLFLSFSFDIFTERIVTEGEDMRSKERKRERNEMKRERRQEKEQDKETDNRNEIMVRE